MEQFKNYINGKWVSAASGKTYQNLNPADQRDVIGEFPLSEAADIDAAVKACKAVERAWMLMPAPKRGDILRKAGDIFTRRKEELSRIMTREMGKPTFETAGDVQEAIDTCYYAATEGRRLFGFNAPSEMENKMNMSFRMPIGVCGIITAWNFPITATTALEVCEKAKVDPGLRTKDLSDEQLSHLTTVLQTYRIEGDLRREIQQNVKRKMSINCYQGIRHKKGLQIGRAHV